MNDPIFLFKMIQEYSFNQGSLYLEFNPKDGLFHKMLLLSLLEFKLAGVHTISKHNPKGHYQLTRKRFSEKPIVAFTNSTVFILDFYIII